MQTRRDVLEEKFVNFRKYLREHSPAGILQKLENEILQRNTDDIWLYIQSQTSLDPQEGVARFVERYNIPKYMHDTVRKYFECFEYLLMEESIDWEFFSLP